MPRFLLIFSLALGTPLAAQKPTTPGNVRRLLSGLADDSMQGRATGTPGAWRAARMIAHEMRRIGLAPLGDSGYYQRVPISGDSAMVGGVWRDSLRLLASLGELDRLPRAGHRPAANILGVIRGSDPQLKDEVVLIDAHYDHLGMRRPSAGGDSIYNGADDDASGVTAVLEIARQLGEGPKPKRTVIFLATIGEEAGLLGTRWFIQHPPIPLARMVANLEIEMIDRPDSLAGGSGRAWLTGYERSTLGEMLAAKGIPIVPDKRRDEHFFERSDNIAFARRGIVAHTLSTFNLHADYHEVSDEVSKADFVHMAGVINAAAKAARILADGKKPAWKAGGRP
ncbi:MAG TPA: M20/M25/M40 family metallo-hydrolase [Gemmatimonadaceae bacterium]|nr:M20/M25/M40 family metallo-hydrolase [Gemmatimonadaceae bacterium]